MTPSFPVLLSLFVPVSLSLSPYICLSLSQDGLGQSVSTPTVQYLPTSALRTGLDFPIRFSDFPIPRFPDPTRSDFPIFRPDRKNEVIPDSPIRFSDFPIFRSSRPIPRFPDFPIPQAFQSASKLFFHQISDPPNHVFSQYPHNGFAFAQDSANRLKDVFQGPEISKRHQETPRALQEAPRALHEAAKALHEIPKTTKDAPKRLPRDPERP